MSLKAQLEAKRKDIQSSISNSNKALRAAVKDKDRVAARSLENKIAYMEKQKKYYAPSVAPCQFENGFVLDGSLLKSYLKKLPATSLEAEFLAEGSTLEVRHKNGKIIFFDRADVYGGLEMSKGEDLLEEFGIHLI